jgi:hypothetical protein
MPVLSVRLDPENTMAAPPPPPPVPKLFASGPVVPVVPATETFKTEEPVADVPIAPPGPPLASWVVAPAPPTPFEESDPLIVSVVPVEN